MPGKGQLLTDKFSGDTIEFIETSADTNGERVTLKVTLRRKGQTIDDHMHILQDELFEVISGKMTYLLNGKLHFANAGEEVVLPKKKAHNHYNTENEPVEYIQTITPGLDTDLFVIWNDK